MKVAYHFQLAQSAWVSIPYRHNESKKYGKQLTNMSLFQFLIGTMKVEEGDILLTEI